MPRTGKEQQPGPETRYQRAGWRHVSLTAQPGFLDELYAVVSGFQRDEAPPGRGRITGVRGPGGVGIDLERPTEAGLGLRELVETHLDAVAPRGSGLLVTIDEVHAGRVEELSAFAVLTQHLLRERPAVRGGHGGSGFCRVRPAEEEGAHVLAQGRATRARLARDRRGRGRAAEATRGYPFLVQLIGHQTWRSTRADHLTMQGVERGVAATRVKMRTLVHEAALNDLSHQDRAFLVAMSADQGSSRIADIAERLGKNGQYTNTYRTRLKSAGIIETPTRGRVSYAIPYLEDTVRDMVDEGVLDPASSRS